MKKMYLFIFLLCIFNSPIISSEKDDVSNSNSSFNWQKTLQPMTPTANELYKEKQAYESALIQKNQNQINLHAKNIEILELKQQQEADQQKIKTMQSLIEELQKSHK
jgi:hypothetical protein